MKAFFYLLWAVISGVLLLFFVNCFYGYFYPLKYKTEIIQYSEKYGINPYIVASIVNIESRYSISAVSNKGAIGLMQILPTTAEDISVKLKIYNYDLFDVNTNLEFGCYYLSYLLDYFEDEDLMICAYNAGLGNVKQWMKNKQYISNGKIVYIPFKETRDYLEKAHKNINYYKKKY